MSRWGHLEDLSGKKYGKLTVIGEYRQSGYQVRWKCLCDCGNITHVVRYKLENGIIRSCGCYQKEDLGARRRKNLLGKRFGKLVVVREEVERKNGHIVWKCTCDCGNDTFVESAKLQSGHTRSCGCLVVEANTKHGMYKTKEYARCIAHKRHEKSKELDSLWTCEMDKLLREFFPVCVVCHGLNKLCADHVKPLVRGYGIKPGNAIILCNACNVSKGGKMPEELRSDIRYKILLACESFRVHYNEVKNANF